MKIITEKPVVPYGTGFWAKAFGLCPGVPAVFTIQSITDPDQYKEFYGAELPDPVNGSTSWVFTPEDLAGFVGPIRVGVYQSSGDCQRGASTNVNIQKDKPPVKTPTVTAPATITAGDKITAEAKNLCAGTVVFAIQSVDDWTVRWFSEPVKVNADGTASFTFPANVIPAASAYTVYAKQAACNVVATTLVKVVKKTETAGSTGSSNTATPESASAAVVPVTPTVTPQVLSGGITAPTSASAATGTTSTGTRATVRSTSDTLPVTGSEPSHTLQIALAAFAAGLGMIIVSSMRRRTANVRSR